MNYYEKCKDLACDMRYQFGSERTVGEWFELFTLLGHEWTYKNLLKVEHNFGSEALYQELLGKVSR